MQKKILVLGQIPPPYHGQAIMIKRTIDADYVGVKLYHINMSFSKEIEEVGIFKVGKLLELFRVIVKVIYYRFKYKTDILYYPPAGAKIIPVLRDIALLLCIRWLFSKTIFHFQAGGLTDLYNQLSSPLKWFFRKAYYYPDLTIRLSELNPEDGKNLRTIKDCIIPNGMEDENCSRIYKEKEKQCSSVSVILYVGMLSEEKGVMVLLEACSILRKSGILFRTNLVGIFESLSFQNKVLKYIENSSLLNYVFILGELTGTVKWSEYASSDIFCFPSHYSAESFGNVLLEAMCFSQPIVATNWRGIPSIVDDQSGFIVPIKNPEAVAEKLEYLIVNPARRKEMGEHARRRFLDNYTLEKYIERMNKAFLEV